MCHHSKRAIDWDAIEAELGERTPGVGRTAEPDEVTGEPETVEFPETEFEEPDPKAELEEPDPEAVDPAATDD